MNSLITEKIHFRAINVNYVFMKYFFLYFVIIFTCIKVILITSLTSLINNSLKTRFVSVHARVHDSKRRPSVKVITTGTKGDKLGKKKHN